MTIRSYDRISSSGILSVRNTPLHNDDVRGQMKKQIVVSLMTMIVMTALVGCRANASSCNDFAAAENHFGDLLGHGRQSQSLDDWRAAQQQAIRDMDASGLSASGDVKQRIEALISIIPDTPTEMLVDDKANEKGPDFNRQLDRVATACQADGTTISLTKVKILTFGN